MAEFHKRGTVRCAEEGCENGALSWGPVRNKCCRHGGGWRCSSAGCPKGSQNGREGHCVAHSRCKKAGCTNSYKGKSGFCRSHASAADVLFAEIHRSIPDLDEYITRAPNLVWVVENTKLSVLAEGEEEEVGEGGGADCEYHRTIRVCDELDFKRLAILVETLRGELEKAKYGIPPVGEVKLFVTL